MFFFEWMKKKKSHTPNMKQLNSSPHAHNYKQRDYWTECELLAFFCVEIGGKINFKQQNFRNFDLSLSN